MSHFTASLTLGLLERTHSVITRAKTAGKRFGRPPALNEEQQQAVIIRLKAGDSISAVAVSSVRRGKQF